MKLTKDRVFVDSNILLYLLSSDSDKKRKAKSVLSSNPVVSVQVISENANVLFKKFPQLSFAHVSAHLDVIANYCVVTPLSFSVIQKALAIKNQYGYQWYDCTILAAAILEQCSILYSEDMAHGQIIDGQLTVINPFVTA